MENNFKKIENFDITKKSIYAYTSSEKDNLVENYIYWLPTKVNKSSIKIYDDILSKEQSDLIFSYCKKIKWLHQQKSINMNANLNYKKIHNYPKNQWSKLSFIFFKSDAIDNYFFYNLFYEKILPQLDCIFDKKNIVISRLYFNTHTPGISGSWHKDGKNRLITPVENNAPTVLLYFNKDWSLNYDGSTSFLLDDNDHDKVFHVNMKHGRIVVFPSYISHKMNDVSYYTLKRNCLRFVVAYHLQYEN